VIKLRKMRWARHVACTEVGRKVYRVLVGRPLGFYEHSNEPSGSIKIAGYSLTS
jgi:hypothetical protein